MLSMFVYHHIGTLYNISHRTKLTISGNYLIDIFILKPYKYRF